MIREVDLQEISDGKLYTANDLVKAGCNDCAGCSACCRGMGNSIVLDPLDMHRLCQGLSLPPEEVLSRALELHVVDGLILPNLKMAGAEEACTFLNEEGRCSVHPYRPGICRLFPLGRVYEAASFRYFLQTNECKKENRTKVKVKKWLDVPDVAAYERFVCTWHFFLKRMGELLASGNEEEQKQMNLYLLRLFFLTPYDGARDFYGQVDARIQTVNRLFGE